MKPGYKPLSTFIVRDLGRSQRFRGPFLESPGNLPGPISIFLTVFSPITQ